MFKKLLLVAALAATVSAAAAPRLHKVAPPVINPELNKLESFSSENIKPVSSRSENAELSFCGNIAGLYSLGSMSEGTCIYQLTELPLELTQNLSASKITAINIVNPSNKQYQNTLQDSVRVLIYTDLKADPVYSQSAKLGANGGQVTKVPLKTPYVIDGSTPVYFGYEMIFHTAYNVESTALFYIVADNGDPFYDLNHIGTAKPGQKPSFKTGTEIGLPCNLCMSADAVLESTPTNMADATVLEPAPAAIAGEDFEVDIEVKNFGINDITSVGIAYSVNGIEETVTYTFDTPLNSLASDYAMLLTKTDATGFAIPITAKIVEVNGQPNSYEEPQTITANISIIEPGKEAARAMVVEEATGTWCGWCPMGYVLLESMRAKYDDLMVIGVHDSDAMATSSYAGFVNQYISGFPQYYVNRYIGMGFFQSAQQNTMYFNMCHMLISSWPAIATIDFNTSVNPENATIDVDTKTTFGISGNANYRLAVVVKEDSVGPYRQENYLYGTAGWGEFSTVARPSVKFNDVAREIKTWNGIDGSIPAEIESGTTYDYSVSISSAKVAGNECDVVVMLINDANGMIEQAACKHVVVKESGIDEVRGSDSGAAAYFDLNGRKLQAPVRGVNIERTANGTVRKIFVK